MRSCCYYWVRKTVASEVLFSPRALLADPPFSDLPPQITNTEASRTWLAIKSRCFTHSRGASTAPSDPNSISARVIWDNPTLPFYTSKYFFLGRLSACYRHAEPSDHSRPSPPSPTTTHNYWKAPGFIKTSCHVLAGLFQTKPITNMWIKTQL